MNRLTNRLLIIVFCMALFVGLSVMDSIGIAAEKGTPPLSINKGTTVKTTANTGPAPEIKFDQKDRTYNLGTIIQMTKTEKIIKFKNIGKGILIIDKVKPG